MGESSIYRINNRGGGGIDTACKTMPQSIENAKADLKLRVDDVQVDTFKLFSNPLHHDFTKVM
jgi:hypothetical protein